MRILKKHANTVFAIANTNTNIRTISIVEAAELQKFKLGANAFLLGVDGL